MPEPGKKSLSQLAAGIRTEAYRIQPGTFWRHYGGGVYEVTGFSVKESTGEIEVTYRPVPTTGTVNGVPFYQIGEPDLSDLQFHRPPAEFFETVDYHDGEMSRQAQRFTQVERTYAYV